MTTRRGRAAGGQRHAAWWAWLLVGTPWLAGMVVAGALVLAGSADDEVAVRAPATVVAILTGSAATVIAAAMLVWLRHESNDDRHLRSIQPNRVPDERHELLRQLDLQITGRLGLVRDLVGTIQSAAGHGPLAETDLAALETVGAEIDVLAATLAQVRTLTDLDRRVLDVNPVDVRSVLTDVAALITEAPGLGGRRLDGPVDVARSTPAVVLGDAEVLHLALHEITRNAVAFTSPGDTITLTVAQEGDEVVVEVSDTGVGIPPDEMPDIWRPFARGRAAGSSAGIGLGLTIARVAVERHGGTVRLRSRVALGTVVTVTLPAASSRPVASH